jgi:hypothetical protein
VSGMKAGIRAGCAGHWQDTGRPGCNPTHPQQHTHLQRAPAGHGPLLPGISCTCVLIVCTCLRCRPTWCCCWITRSKRSSCSWRQAACWRWGAVTTAEGRSFSGAVGQLQQPHPPMRCLLCHHCSHRPVAWVTTLFCSLSDPVLGTEFLLSYHTHVLLPPAERRAQLAAVGAAQRGVGAAPRSQRHADSSGRAVRRAAGGRVCGCSGCCLTVTGCVKGGMQRGHGPYIFQRGLYIHTFSITPKGAAAQP